MNTITTILDRVLGPLGDTLSAEDVRRISSLPRDAEMDQRVEELAGKANEGQLAPEKRREYETYIEASEFVAILLARARARLRHAA